MTPSIPHRRERLNLGMTIPLVLVVTFLAELALRAVGIEHFALRSTEAMRTFAEGTRPFAPSSRFRKDRSYGDLAALANLRRLRQYRSETFMSDALGYRIAPSRDPTKPPGAILVGDSFGVAGTEDSETLASQLASRWGQGVYNASDMAGVADLEEIRFLAKRLGMRRGGLVLYEYLERQELPGIPKYRPRVARKARTAPTEDASTLDALLAKPRQWWTLSRSRILAERAYRFLQDDRILPNPYARNAAVRRLPNGREMLFLPIELDQYRARRPVDARYWKWLEAELARDGLRLLVLLVPNKYTVYAPLLSDATAGDGEGGGYLDALERALRAERISAVNLKEPFRARAEEEVAGDSYLYWLDDTHWNAVGTGVAATEIAEAITKGTSYAGGE